MSKNSRKERKVNALSDLSTVVDVASLPAADQLPEETGAPLPETEETEQPEEVIPTDPVEPAVEQAIAESSTVEEVAAAFAERGQRPAEPVAQTHEVRVQPEVEHPEDLPNEPPSPEPDTTATNVPDQGKSEEPVVAAKEIPKAALELIEALQAQINLLKVSKASRKVASGSKARPNVTYTLLAKPPAWHSTPQVAQLQQILFNPAFLEAHRQADGSIKVSEPDLFAQVVAGHAAGILRTQQEPIRVLQYYRSILLNSNCLRWR